MSAWTHSLCGWCWNEVEPEKTLDNPAQFTQGDFEVCCRCGRPTHSGIYYRADPAAFNHCRHGEDA